MFISKLIIKNAFFIDENGVDYDVLTALMQGLQ